MSKDATKIDVLRELLLTHRVDIWERIEFKIQALKREWVFFYFD